MSCCRSSTGRLFHSRGPAIPKLLSPSLDCVRGTVRRVDCRVRTDRVEEKSRHSSSTRKFLGNSSSVTYVDFFEISTNYTSKISCQLENVYELYEFVQYWLATTLIPVWFGHLWLASICPTCLNQFLEIFEEKFFTQTNHPCSQSCNGPVKVAYRIVHPARFSGN